MNDADLQLATEGFYGAHLVLLGKGVQHVVESLCIKM